MHIRKCQWVHMALLGLCIALPTQSWALGLGEIEVESALNERLSGSIEVLDAQGLQASEIVVSMASREDFERVGVERFFYLTNIRFAVELGANGTAKVNVSSSQPISEPYLNFIVELFWPNGRLLKEYTVLLDPPTFSQAAAPAVSAPSQPVAQAPASRSTAPAVNRAGTQVDLRPPGSAAPRRQLPDGLMTTREDTLWKIASASLPSNSVTVNQQMLAIQRKNPQAFIRDNINLLKAGYVLDMPTESEALSVDQVAANSDVASQTEDWRSGGRREQVADTATQLIDTGDVGAAPELRSQVDATARQQTAAVAADEGQGQVRIVASTGEQATGTASGDDASVNQLLEEKESLSRQVDELTYQLDREKEIAVNQVTVKERQLEVKDQELAQLQQQMKEMREQLAQVVANQNQNQNPESVPADTPLWMSPLVLLGVIGVLILVLAFALIALRRNRGDLAEPYDEAAEDYLEVDEVPQAQVAAAVADLDEEEVAETDSGAVEPFIGALAAHADIDELHTGHADAEVFGLDVDESAEVTEGAEDLEAAEAAAAVQPQQSQAADDEAGHTGDVIGEAEIYIAYGRFGQAANLLTGVLGREPDRWDVRLKLLEVYVESHDEENFGTHAQYVVDNCDDEDVLLACRELEAQLRGSHVDMSADGASAEKDLGLGGAAAGAELSDDEGFALELDDFELPEDAAATAAPFEDLSAAEMPNGDDAASEIGQGDGNDDADDADDASAALEPEFELEFDGEPGAADDGVVADEDDAEMALDLDVEIDLRDADSGAGEDLGGDLGLDFDPDAEAADVTDVDETADTEVAADAAPVAAQVTAEEDIDDFEFSAEADSDINATKLDLAEAYVDMGDADGAQDILGEVLEEGTPEQVQKAQEMLASLAH